MTKFELNNLRKIIKDMTQYTSNGRPTNKPYPYKINSENTYDVERVKFFKHFYKED